MSAAEMSEHRQNHLTLKHWSQGLAYNLRSRSGVLTNFGSAVAEIGLLYNL